MGLTEALGLSGDITAEELEQNPLTAEVKEILDKRGITLESVSELKQKCMNLIKSFHGIGFDEFEAIKEKIKHRYDAVGNLWHGFARVNKGGKWGFVDITGQEVVAPIYDRVEDFDCIENGFANVYVDCKCDENGNIIEHAKWLEIDSKGNEYDLEFCDGLASIKGENGWGYVNTKGEVVIPFEYEYANDFKNGKAEVRTNTGEKFYIDTKGNKIKENKSKEV